MKTAYIRALATAILATSISGVAQSGPALVDKPVQTCPSMKQEDSAAANSVRKNSNTAIQQNKTKNQDHSQGKDRNTQPESYNPLLGIYG